MLLDPAADRYVAAVISNAARALGGQLSPGSTVVATADRAGSTTAVAYPLGEHTVIWCAPELAARLAPLRRREALTADEFLLSGERLGGTFAGSGRNRVLAGEPASLSDARYRIVELSRDEPADREHLAAFVDACSEADLDEAELDLDDLDPAILALVDDAGSIASYASARPWWMDADFDDIAVLTHPDHRGRRLGAIAVAEFARRRIHRGRSMFYNHDVDNRGSNRVAETVGFEVVATVVAVDFG